MKARLFWLAAMLLFCAGLARFGIPPLHADSSNSRKEEIPTTSTLSQTGRMVISHNSGAPESDKKRLHEQEVLNALFMQRYPDSIRFNSTWQFSPDTFFAKYISGTLPDVIGLFATEATLVVDRKMAADITEQLRAWKYFPYLNEKLLAPVTRDGRFYGMPIGEANGGFYVMTLFYNTEMFKRAGLTDQSGTPIPPDSWDDFTTYALKLTDRRHGVAGFGILGENGGNAWHFLNWVWQAGGEFEHRLDNGRWISVFDQPPAVLALQFIKDLRWKHDVLQRNVLATNDELFQMFASDRIAMAFFTPEYLTYIVDKYNMPIEKIGICLLPAGPAGRANQIGGSYVILNPRLSGIHKQRAFDSAVFSYDPVIMDAQLKVLHDQDRRIGIPAIPIFKPELQNRINAVVNKYRNLPDYSALMLQAADAVRLEPPYRCQAMYSLYLGPVLQEVLVNRDANCLELLKRAAYKFQVRELDPRVNAKTTGLPI
jgi:ABC-type glycerol-3-phosphate transport system substrate-binding protein